MITVRETTADDRGKVLVLVGAAFATGGRDGREEVEIVEETWRRNASPPGFDLVAVDDHTGEITGHVLAARGDLAGRAILGVAPLAVSPARQRAGVASALMRELIARADAAGERMLVLLGSTDYYPRFGFEPAGPLGIHYRPVGENNPHFQVRTLAAFDDTAQGDFVYCWELPLTLP